MSKEKKGLVFIIDTGVLIEMFENKKKTPTEVLRKLYEMKKKGVPFKAFATLNCFLRAMWKIDPKIKVENVQKILEVITIMPVPSQVDYKNDDEVMMETIKIAKLIGEGGKKK